MKHTRILALALLLAIGTGFAASAQQDTTQMKKKVKTTKVHKKMTKDSTTTKP